MPRGGRAINAAENTTNTKAKTFRPMNEAELALLALASLEPGDKVRYKDGRVARVLSVCGRRVRLQWLRPIGYPRRGIAPVYVVRENLAIFP